MKSLEQLKIDQKNNGWLWKIEHPNDERALLNGCQTDFNAAEKIRKFFEKLLKIPGASGGMVPFVLLDWWYSKILAPLYGWKRKDGRRRFDKGFITTAKKSGKSTVLSGLPLFAITADGEEEAEAYSTAVDRDQAAIIYKKTDRMVKLSESLSRVIHRVPSQKRLLHDASGSWYEAISSDADSAEGKNPHLLIADELHVWKDRQFFSSLMYGDIRRSQPLFLMITTAGDDEECIGYEEYQFARDLLDPNNDFYSESHFAFIAEADKERNWDDPEGWIEACPSLSDWGTTAIEKLEAKCLEAKKTPRKQRDFKRYICNWWVNVNEKPWINIDDWRACKSDLLDHGGEKTWGGLDLSRTMDLTALCMAFSADDCIEYFWRFWCPKDRIREHEDNWRVPLSTWIREGWVIATPGNSVDYAWVRREISGIMLDELGKPLEGKWENNFSDKYVIQTIGFDPWNSSKIITELNEYDGVSMVPVRQGYASLNSPCKEIERRIADKKIRHGGNPVMDWMIRNCITDDDPAGNIKPSKKKSRQKIDGVSAMVIATHEFMLAVDKSSKYEKEGMTVL